MGCARIFISTLEVEYEIATAHSRISVQMSVSSEMDIKKPGCVYSTDTVLRARGRGRWRCLRRSHMRLSTGLAHAHGDGPGHMFSPSPALALGPVLAVVERLVLVSASSHHATACAPPCARNGHRAQGTSMSRFGHPFSPFTPAFLVECGVRMQ
jgi:hypothetical protein